MADREITFIDVDENPLVVWLKEDRVQLFVVDSQPELEANELRGFATALFAAYVGGPLAQRLEAARAKIDGVRERLAATGGSRELVAALDGSLSVIADARDAMSAAARAVSPAEPAPCTPFAVAGRRRSSSRGRRAGEGPLLGWGWRRDEESPAAAR
jgi:hypothetical protein